eukprot:TRINITY_DN10653_c0_g1_i1.p1 TRINITY_DN10653_c0_g1~~TRINITY_DN10653_c0_g1_i1.p1  ORF type:complete len:355 (+),score=94.26 TRINITY_DN10653_c0_g1_i1:43-1107(+)
MLNRTLRVLTAAKRLESQVTLDVVGSDSLAGVRMRAGSMLGLMDLCAVRSAQRHCGNLLKEHKGSVVTVAVDGCDFSRPVLNGDLIRFESKPVLVGSSSVAVRIEAHRRSLRSRDWDPVQAATYTMVAVDTNLRPIKGIPALEYVTPEDHALRKMITERKKIVSDWAKLNKDLQDETEFTPVPVDPRYVSLPMSDTKIVMRRLFLPRNVNMNNTIFGGDVLEWMETGAIHCAMNFVGHRDIVTIAMNRVEFKHPITISNWVELHAEVVYASKYTVHVEISIEIENFGETGHERVTSHVGHFVCMPLCPSTGRKETVMTGLSIPETDTASLRKHHAARYRYDFWKRHYKGTNEYK